MIDSYRFGVITINGVQYRSDCKILNDTVFPGWWRGRGHRVHLSEIADILIEDVEICIIGQGASGLMQLAPDIAPALEKRKIILIAQKSDVAANAYNEHTRFGKCVAAAFHLTC